MNTNKRILIVEVVDDEVLERNALREKLTHEGFAILEAKDGQEGLEVALREHPDLILLDIKMPKMDGITMLHALRGDEWGKDARVIILTNLDASDQRLSQVVAEQPSFYLMKATNSLEEILEKVRETLHPHLIAQ